MTSYHTHKFKIVSFLGLSLKWRLSYVFHHVHSVFFWMEGKAPFAPSAPQRISVFPELTLRNVHIFNETTVYQATTMK